MAVIKVYSGREVGGGELSVTGTHGRLSEMGITGGSNSVRLCPLHHWTKKLRKVIPIPFSRLQHS